LNFHDAGLEFVVGKDGSVLYAGLVGVDGIDRVLEDLRDLFIVADAHADEGEDAEIDVEEFVFFKPDLILFLEEGVEPADEVGEDTQKDGVKAAEELFFFFL
jgi:hypothetical protein